MINEDNPAYLYLNTLHHDLCHKQEVWFILEVNNFKYESNSLVKIYMLKIFKNFENLGFMSVQS